MLRVLICSLSLLGLSTAARAGELDRELAPAQNTARTEVARAVGSSTEMDAESPQQAHGWRGGWGYHGGWGGYGGYGWGGYGGYGGFGFAPAFYSYRGLGFGYGYGYGGFGFGYGGFGYSPFAYYNPFSWGSYYPAWYGGWYW